MTDNPLLNGLEIHKTLILSTAHITADENERLEEFIRSFDNIDPHVRPMLGGCLDVVSIPYAYWIHWVGMWAPDSDAKPWDSLLLRSDYPNLVRILRFMSNHGLTYLILDRDAQKSDLFTVFDW